MGHKIAHGYVMLDSRINIVKPRKRSISHEQLHTSSLVVYFNQDLAIANMNYTIPVTKLSYERFVSAIGCSSIVSGCHVRHKGINAS